MAKLPRPTDGELAILRVLWEIGPASVREIHTRLGRATAYTTVLKLLQIMTVKGLVRRDEKERTHIYTAAVPADRTQRQIVKDIVERVFGGSAGKLVLQALSSNPASAEEMAEIRRLLDEHEKKGGAA